MVVDHINVRPSVHHDSKNVTENPHVQSPPMVSLYSTVLDRSDKVCESFQLESPTTRHLSERPLLLYGGAGAAMLGALYFIIRIPKSRFF